MFDENDNLCHAMHHHHASHVVSGLFISQSSELITPDIHESYSSDVAGSTVSDVLMLFKFEAEEKMFGNNDKQGENKPPAHDGPLKSPLGESATISTATNIPAEPVNHDHHKLHL